MNYKLTKKEAKELIVNKLSHFYGVSPEEANMNITTRRLPSFFVI